MISDKSAEAKARCTHLAVYKKALFDWHFAGHRVA